MTGYDLWKTFDQELAGFWRAKHSQIYVELKKLYEEGDVTYQIEISGDVLEKKEYRLTEQGRQSFLEWLGREEKIAGTTRDSFRVRMFFSSDLPVDERLRLLKNQKDQHDERLNALQLSFDQYAREGIPAYDSPLFGDYIVLEEAVIREKATVYWLDKCIGYCENALKFPDA